MSIDERENCEAAPPPHLIRPFIHVSLLIMPSKNVQTKKDHFTYTFPACQAMWSNDCRFVLFILCIPPSHLAWIPACVSVYAAPTNKCTERFERVRTVRPRKYTFIFYRNEENCRVLCACMDSSTNTSSLVLSQSHTRGHTLRQKRLGYNFFRKYIFRWRRRRRL